VKVQQIMGERPWIIDPIEEWSQLWTGCNWYNITPLALEFEWDKIFGAVEARFVLVGVGIRFRWTYAETEEAQNLKRRADRIRRQYESGENPHLER
jgi:hypothetical protein